MRIGKTKEELQKENDAYETKRAIAKKRNRENIGGTYFNIFYTTATTSEVMQNTLSNLTSKYSVYFDYEPSNDFFIVKMNTHFLYGGTFNEMEQLMQKGIKSYYLKFWDDLVSTSLSKEQ